VTLRPRGHENKDNEILGGSVANTVRLVRSRNDGLARGQFPLLISDMEHPPAAENKRDLIRFRMSVDALILPGLQAVYVEEVPAGFKDWDFLELLFRESDKVLDVLNLHFFQPSMPTVPSDEL